MEKEIRLQLFHHKEMMEVHLVHQTVGLAVEVLELLEVHHQIVRQEMVELD